MARRIRRGRSGLAALLGFVLLLGVAVAGVVVLLRGLDVEAPLVAGCTATADGASASLAPDQAANAALIAAIAVDRGLPARAATIAIATSMQESKLRNIDYGDRDSLGLFQQRPSQGWGTAEQVMDPVYATNAFYDALVTIDGYADMEITEAAQAVQRSGYPEAYAQHERTARLFASALTGWSRASLVCRLGEPDGAETAVADLLARDLASAHSAEVPDSTDGSTAVGLSLDLVESSRATWVLAHWAVATAELTGAQQVTVGDLAWSRADGADAGWTTTDHPAPDGLVLVR